MRPGSIRTKQQFARPSSPDGLNQIIELPHRGRVRIHVRITRNLINHLLMCFPVVGEAAEVRNDEIHVRILRSQHVHNLGTAHHIHQHGNPKSPCSFTHFPRRHGVEPVHFDATKPPFLQRPPHHVGDSTRIPFGVNESESHQPVRVSRYQAAQVIVGFRVITMEGRNGDRLVDARRPGAAQVGLNRRNRVPGRGHAVAFSRVAVTIDDHDRCHSVCACIRRALRSLAAAARYQMLVAIAL